MSKFLFILHLSIFSTLLGKTQETQTYTIQRGSDIYNQIPRDQIYLYRKFSAGKVLFRDGKEYEASLNYNTVAAEIEFVSENKDTASLVDKFDIKLVTIGMDTFYYDNKFVKLLGENGRWQYASDNRFVVVGKKGIVENQIFYSRGGLGRTLQDWEQPVALGERIVIKRKELFYIGDQLNKFWLLDKQTILKLFPAHSARIKTFLRKNKLTLNSEPEVIALLTFLNQLS